jgi:hypothetical protein
VKVIQQLKLFFIRGYYDFAAYFIGYFIFITKSQQFVVSIDTISGFQAAGLIVEPTVNDPAVMSGLMLTNGVFLFQDNQPGLRPGLQYGVCSGQPYNAASYDDDVGLQSIRFQG